MIKLKETIVIEIACEGSDPAKITFAKPRLNKILDNASLDAKSPDGTKELYSRLASQVLDVVGVEYEDGTKLTAEGLKQLDVPLDFMLEVIKAYNKATTPKEDPEAAEKKEQKPESSSA